MNEEIARLEKELKILKEKQKKFEEKPIEVQIATSLHDALCNANHTDQCSWYYHEHNWDEYTHKRYLNKALEVINFSQIYNIKPEFLVDLIVKIRR